MIYILSEVKKKFFFFLSNYNTVREMAMIWLNFTNKYYDFVNFYIHYVYTPISVLYRLKSLSKNILFFVFLQFKIQKFLGVDPDHR